MGKEITQNCDPHCGHTMQEHLAFDAGVQAGRDGSNDELVRHQPDNNLREAWLTGFSVGKLDREAAAAAEEKDEIPSDEKIVEQARKYICGSDDIEIDDLDKCDRCNTTGPIKLSRADDGCWVAAWVWVSYEEIDQ